MAHCSLSTSERTSKTGPAAIEISVIIPVLHETERINSLIQILKKQPSCEKCEIIVVDGDSDGETINAINHSGVISTVSEPSRAKQMNAGAALAGGKVLVFLHADTTLPLNAFEKIEELLQDSSISAGAFDLGINSDRFIYKWIAFWGRIRSRATRVPFGDQAIFIRKDYFESIGRYREIDLMEDVELMRRIKKRGDKILILKDRVQTSARRWGKEGAVFGTVRNIVLLTMFYLGADPNKLAKYYRKNNDKKQN